MSCIDNIQHQDMPWIQIRFTGKTLIYLEVIFKVWKYIHQDLTSKHTLNRFPSLQRIPILPHFASLCRLSLFESSKSEVSTKFSPFLSSNAMYTPMDQTSETHNSQRMNKKNTIVLSPSSLLILLFFSECSEHIMAFNTLQSFCTSFLWYKPCGIMLNTQY